MNNRIQSAIALISIIPFKITKTIWPSLAAKEAFGRD